MNHSLTEDLACGTVMRDLKARSFVIPRYTPWKWWECDVFEITATGYFREYEVKLSLEDFRADAKKERSTPIRLDGGGWKMENKHAFLSMGAVLGPSAFSFVAPAGLIPVGELPSWAGLIELHDRGEDRRPSFRWSMHMIVKAPRLHKQKVADAVVKHSSSVCYYRMHTAMEAMRNREGAPNLWLDEIPPPELDLATATSPAKI